MTRLSCFALACVLLFPVTLLAAERVQEPRPLTVCKANPRYFTADGVKPVVLVGTDTWYSSMRLGDCWTPAWTTANFDYAGYLAWLKAHGMNFTRFWQVERPYRRSETSGANDGRSKFQLDTVTHGWNNAYFDNMIQRVTQAKAHGVFVGVMLSNRFNAWDAGSWAYHSYNGVNNVNGIDGNDTDGVAPNYHFGYKIFADTSGPIWDLQTAYVRKVIDTLHNCDNVLYEIQNEGDATSIDWQYAMIDYIHDYEQKTYGYKHPVGLTVGWGNEGSGPNWSRETLLNSRADWIAPGNCDAKGEQVYDYGGNPLAADGKKVVIVQGDHIATTDFFKHTDAKKPEKQNKDYDFVWKNFTRGNSVIPLDDLGNSGLKGVPRGSQSGTIETWAAQKGAGIYAAKINLAAMTPAADASVVSTGYALINPGREYLVYQPNADSDQFTVDLPAYGERTFSVEWMKVFDGGNNTVTAGSNVSGGGVRTLTQPSKGTYVAWLKSK